MEDVENAIFEPQQISKFSWGTCPQIPHKPRAFVIHFQVPRLENTLCCLRRWSPGLPPPCVSLYRRSSIDFKIKIILILNLEFHKATVSGHYCFLSMLANFLRSSNHIFLIPIVMQMTGNCISHLDQEMIWRRPLL